MTTLRTTLEDAYMETTYEFTSAGICWKLRIGDLSDEFQHWLSEQKVTKWSMITAYNPYSKMLPVEENIRLQQTLENEVNKRGWRVERGLSYGDDGEWPPEPMLWIAGCSRYEAMALGGMFQQAAIVWGEQGGCELVFLDE